MRKLILTMVAAAGVAVAASVFAQGSGYDSQSRPQTPPNPANVTPYGPIPGTPEYYGNSGWTPDMAYGSNVYPNYRYGYPPAVRPGWREPRHVERNRDRLRSRRDRDRDGDGIPNNLDRYPNDPSRW